MHGPDGIVPTRGQVVAVRANKPSALDRSGFIGNDGFEYWFPRPHNPNNSSENELIIVGGGREAAQGKGYEFYEVDDSVVNTDVGKVLRSFLPVVFPGKFENDTEPEMEWVGTMSHKIIENQLIFHMTDRYHGLYKISRAFREFLFCHGHSFKPSV